MLAFIFSSCDNLATNMPLEDIKVDFDESNIILAFAAMSDVHIDTSYTYGKNAVKFDNALKYVKRLAGERLDALFFAGDITQRFSIANFQLVSFKKIIEQNFNVANGEIEVIIGTGNHDSSDGMFSSIMPKFLSDDYYRTDIDRESVLKGNRHCTVNDFHFITIEPQSYGDMPGGYKENAANVIYSEETLMWLDKILKEITTENPNKPVFVASHAMVYDTVYGSMSPGWYTENLEPILSKYPQVILFSGHMHNQLNNERAIMQTSFTAVDCGSVRSIGNGNIIDQYFTKSINVTSEDRQSFSQGNLVEVDGDNNVRIRRLDFFNEAEIGEPWIIPAPRNDNLHLTLYTKDRADLNKPPYFKDEAAISFDTKKSNDKDLCFTFDAAQGEDMIYSYIVEINRSNPTSDAKESEIYYLSSLSFLYPKVENMPESYSFTIRKPSPGEYEMKIQAVDIWDKKSHHITTEFTIE
jgi:predicted phosphodiesterase